MAYSSRSHKEFESEDPFERVQVFLDLPADDCFFEEMARTFIEEYMLLGWNDDEILEIFTDPFYYGTHHILQEKGEAFVKNLIQEVRHG